MAFTNELKFSDLTKMLEAVSATADTKKKNKFICEYFTKLKQFQSEFKRKGNKDCSILPVMRMMLAQEEKERAYNIQEKSLRQLYIKVLLIGKESSDAKKIAQCSEKSLPDTIYEVIKSRVSDGPGMSIYQVDNILALLAEDSKQSSQEAHINTLIQGTSALDQKWIVKIILKRRVTRGIPVNRVLDLYHPLANQLLKKFLHVSKVIELIESGQAENSLVEVVEVFTPMRAMLAQKFNNDLNKNKLSFSEMYAETKMDGERFQLHMKNGTFRYYSRNLHEYSEGFNELITPLIKFKSVVHSVILDGEMMVYDKDSQRYHTKGELEIDVKYMKSGKYPSKFRPCFCAFDVLFLNDRSYLNDPYTKRHQVLAQLFDDRDGVFVKTKPVKIRDADHIADLFNEACENEEEGIVLKQGDSIYAPGERTEGWYKVKADYFDDDVCQDFDCVIIGGFYKNPHLKNYFRRYLLGVVEKQEDGRVNVYACGEVVSGIKFQERMKLQQTLNQNLVEHAGESEIDFGKGKIFFGKRKPEAWIAPDKSVVLECRLNELRKSTQQFTEYTFRFPRIINIRRDKLWDESCTLKEFREFCERDDGKVQKVVKRNVKLADIISPSRKRKAGNSRAAITAKFCHNSQDSEEIEVIDKVLEGKEFCVLTTGENLPSIKAMKVMVKKHGGTCVEYPRNGKTFAIVVGVVTNFVNNFMKSKNFNVVKAEWLVKNFGDDQTHKEMPKIRPIFDFVFMTEEMKNSLRESFDDFGDSYTDAIETEEDLKVILNAMKVSGDCELMEIDYELERIGVKSSNFFASVKGKFFSFKNFLMRSSEPVFKFHGGSIVEDVNKADFVIVSRDNLAELEEFKKDLEGKTVVDFQWILDSSDSGYKINFEDYLAV